MATQKAVKEWTQSAVVLLGIHSSQKQKRSKIVSDTKLNAKTSDLSIGGCFLDMLNPSPEGTEIQVRISHASTTFTARGRVVFVFPNMGIGVVFTSVEANQVAVLQKWLLDLSRGE